MSAPSLNVYTNGGPPVSGDNYNTFEQISVNVAQLRTFVGTGGMQVYLQGFVSQGDGGQGPFYWNVTGTGPDDGGVTNVVPSGAVTGCWTRLAVSFPSLAASSLFGNPAGSAEEGESISLGLGLRFVGTSLADAVAAALVYLPSSAQSIPNNTSTAVSWQGTLYDTVGFWNASFPTRLTIPSTVSYVVIRGQVQFNSPASATFGLNLQKNGTGYVGDCNQSITMTSSTGYIVNFSSGPIPVSTGDYFTVSVTQNSGGALTLAQPNPTWMTIQAVQ